jgi:hypothetical protein
MSRSVYEIDGDVLRHRATIEMAPREGMVEVVIGPFAEDLDGDGIVDVVAAFNYQDGLIRDGGALWARGGADGTFASLDRIVKINLSGFALVDLDGKVGSEMVLLEYGNPFDKQNPQGRLLVYRGKGARWQQASALLVAQEPERLEVADVDGDGRRDAIVQHDLDSGSAWRVYLGKGLSFAPPDPAVAAPPFPDAPSLDADLDGDGARDDAVRIDERTLSAPGEISWKESCLVLRRARPFREAVDDQPQRLRYPPRP